MMPDRWSDGDLESAEHRWVSRLLDAQGDVEPPRELTARVMAEIGRWPSRRIGGGHTMARKILLGVAAIAAALLISFAVTGYPPVGKGIEGTIGAANRYQAPQIGNDDVKVQDPELQAFFQSDAFHKLTTDKKAREAVTSKEFRQAVADPAVRAALAIPAVQGALAAQAVQEALSSSALVNALASQAVQQAMASQGVQAALASQAVQAALAGQPAVQAALASQAFQAALASQAFQAALANQAFQAALATPAFMRALG